LRILIIGSQGFVGKHVLFELINKFGIKSIYSTSVKDKELLGTKHCSEIRITQGNIKTLSDFIQTNRITCVINAAGVIGLDSNTNPDIEIAKTIVNSFWLLENKPFLIHIGSSSEYTSVGMDVDSSESSECHPISIYGKNKLVVTKYLINASEQYKFKLCVCRVFNIIGPNMNMKTILGRLYNEIVLNGKKNIEFRSLASYRDYIDIRDVSSAIIKLVKHINNAVCFSKIINIGTGSAIHMRSLIEQIKNSSTESFDFIEADETLNDENIPWQQANIEKIQKIIDWCPQYTTPQSIEYFLNREDENVN
jgi:NDP-hexose 4-ketoreductase